MTAKTEKPKRGHAPWMPAPYRVKDVAAVQAVCKGIASEGQQKHAIDYILFTLCGIRDLSYRPESDRDTAFAEGKRFVGLQLGKINNINLEQLKKLEKTL